MSNSKLRYYEVTTVQYVQALNKGDAELMALGQRGLSGRVISSDTWSDRITAAEAHAAEAS